MAMRSWTRVVVSGLIAAAILVAPVPPSGQSQAAEDRVIYVAAIEPKGGATVDKESFPAGELPKGGGYVKKAPDGSGRWEVSTYQWSPATIVVRQGDRVTLEIIGINGTKHSGHIDKYVPQHFLVKRGEITHVQFTADTPGVFKIHCEEHQPSMEGMLVVLPR